MVRRAIGIAVGIGCIALLLVAVPRPPPRPRSYYEAVVNLLERRGIAYQKVVVMEDCMGNLPLCAEQQYRWSFSATNVRIVTPSQESATGRIDCYYYRTDCYLSVPSLGLVNVPLRDLAGERSRPYNFERVVTYIKELLSAANR